MKRALLLVGICGVLTLTGCSDSASKTQVRGPDPVNGSQMQTNTSGVSVTSTSLGTVGTLPDAPWNKVAQTKQEWDDPQSYPAEQPSPRQFWVIDQPTTLQAAAFGVLPTEREPGPTLQVQTYALATSLPQAPTNRAVYIAGRYPDNYVGRLNQIVVRDGESWNFISEYSLVQHSSQQIPLGDQVPNASQAQVEAQAQQLLRDRGLLLPDAAVPTTYRQPDGTWRVFFYQHINGLPVYANKVLVVAVNQAGQATEILGRRRPLLRESSYPARTPEEAWKLLQEGGGHTFYVNDGASWENSVLDRFVVTSIEVAYIEAEPTSAQQVIQPYYVFRNDAGRTLYISAIADTYVMPS